MNKFHFENIEKVKEEVFFNLYELNLVDLEVFKFVNIMIGELKNGF